MIVEICIALWNRDSGMTVKNVIAKTELNGLQMYRDNHGISKHD